MASHEVHYVDALTDDIIRYNQLVPPSKTISVKTQCNPWSLAWIIPDEYNTLDVSNWVTNKHKQVIKDLSLTDIQQRNNRIVQELEKFHEFDLISVLRTIIYVINTLTEHNVVWGVGRGSSTASYVLYVIGVHDVDSYLYDLDINDFLH